MDEVDSGRVASGTIGTSSHLFSRRVINMQAEVIRISRVSRVVNIMHLVTQLVKRVIVIGSEGVGVASDHYSFQLMLQIAGGSVVRVYKGIMVGQQKRTSVVRGLKGELFREFKAKLVVDTNGCRGSHT